MLGLQMSLCAVSVFVFNEVVVLLFGASTTLRPARRAWQPV